MTNQQNQYNQQFDDRVFREKYSVHSLMRNSTNGVIYAAFDKVKNRHVVMKQIKKSSRLQGRLPREILMHQAASQVGVGIVKLHEWYERQKTFVMVLERPAHSVDLFEFSKINGPLAETVARYIFHQVVETVLQLRLRGITHHDIKDENVLINVQTLKCKVIDFGCARNYSNQEMSALIGTPEFFPPEWFQTGRYTQDGATVWSLGCLLYVLLFASPPFARDHFKSTGSSGSSESAKTYQHISSRPLVQASLSPSAFDLLCQMLHPDPVQRPSLEQIVKHPFWTTNLLTLVPLIPVSILV